MYILYYIVNFLNMNMQSLVDRDQFLFLLLFRDAVFCRTPCVLTFCYMIDAVDCCILVV